MYLIQNQNKSDSYLFEDSQQAQPNFDEIKIRDTHLCHPERSEGSRNWF